MNAEKNLYRVVVSKNNKKIRIGDFPDYSFAGALRQASEVDATGEISESNLMHENYNGSAYCLGKSKKNNVFVKDNGKLSQHPDYVDGDHLSLIGK